MILIGAVSCVEPAKQSSGTAFGGEAFAGVYVCMHNLAGSGATPLFRLHLRPDGTYSAEDLVPEHLWIVEGTRSYPWRLPPAVQEGTWRWRPDSAELALMADGDRFFRFGLGGVRVEPGEPPRLKWGSKHLERESER
jgi:hypothetical protein